VTAYEKNTREYLKARLQMFEAPWQVRTKAERRPAPEMPTSGKESARQKYHCMLTLKKSIEARLLSNEDALEEGGGNQDATRGALQWLNPSAQTLYPVPADYRPTSAMEYTSAVGSFAETSLETMLKAMYGVRKAAMQYDLFAGVDLKARIDTFLIVAPDVSNHTVIRAVNFDGAEKTVERGVTFIETSFGTVRAHIASYLATDADTGADTAYSPKSGILVDLKKWELRFAIDGKPTMYDQPDLGGGPRGFCRAELMLVCKNPQAQGRIYTNS
jgi:hypothetical protein